MSDMRPLHILAGEGQVTLQHHQVAVTHEQPQAVQVHPVTQAPKRERAPKPVWGTWPHAGIPSEAMQQRLQPAPR